MKPPRRVTAHSVQLQSLGLYEKFLWGQIDAETYQKTVVQDVCETETWALDPEDEPRYQGPYRTPSRK